ncbi:hypothetical protein Dsin_004902 [Dipteronia sinensis]|uniref:Reverse transcriptase domain-containing protein n=1 Tax=Dipteronia sinensis TaxID=43782 RepID=A0AAE0EFZ5_9ROSI|nr:hypothetical protein Dsin_004902 [Dipteronia sinensis]
MSKAYDGVEWNFLAGMMSKLGFSSGWIDCNMRCVLSVSFSFLINGEVCGSLQPSLGLRQGDPLSLYLFFIYAEGLSCLFHIVENIGDISGFRCSRRGPKISHLFFPDDSMIFTKASERDCRTIKHILEVYSRASGQVVNFNKSALCVSKSVSRQRVRICASTIGVQLVGCHERHLGLPSFVSKNKSEVFKSIKDRVWNRLYG